MKKLGLGLIVILIAAAGIWFYLAQKNKAEPPRNVILITIDTLRADHLGAYGYGLAQTPNIDRMAAEGAQFLQATATTPLTLPAHSSIMTGVYPTAHGVRDNGGFYLDSKWQTLAETMKAGGFATGGFVSAFVLDRRWGIAQGFDEYFDHFELSKFKLVSLDSVQRRGDETMNQAIGWISKKKDGRFFAWIHLYDPHTPYDPPEPFRSEFIGRPYGLYDGEIAFTDSLIGKLNDFLKQNNLDRTTMIVLTADHGESLGDHNESAHGFFIYDSTTHVPLIIHLPNMEPRKISDQVRSVDLYPTICDAVGLKPPKIEGVSLLPLVRTGKLDRRLEAYSESYFPKFHYGWSELKAIRTTSYKYIEAPRPEFYRLPEDTTESNNLYGSESKKAEPFRESIKAISAHENSSPTAAPRPVDEDSLEKLQALGYIGSFTSSASTNSGQPLPDPKDKIRLYNAIKRAQGDSAEGNTDEAMAALQRVLAEDPGILEAHLTVGNLLLKKNDIAGARNSFQAALKIDPNSAAANFGMAFSYEKEENWDAARTGFERVLQIDSRDSKALFHLGDIALAQKKFDDALLVFRQAVEKDPEQATSRTRLGVSLLEMKRYNEALQEFQKALQLNDRIPNAHFNSALVFEERNDFDAAVQEYKKELSLFPEAYPAHFNLSRIYRKRGDLDAERGELDLCIKTQPDFGVAYLYLAKNWMDSGRDLQGAKDLAEQGIAKTKDNENLTFGHFLLADLYNRLGQEDRAMDHVRRAQELQKSTGVR